MQCMTVCFLELCFLNRSCGSCIWWSWDTVAQSAVSATAVFNVAVGDCAATLNTHPAPLCHTLSFIYQTGAEWNSRQARHDQIPNETQSSLTPSHSHNFFFFQKCENLGP